MSDYYFHGDVVLKKIDEIPKDAKKKEDNILAKGELTGHAHTIQHSKAELYEKDGILYLKNKKPIEIKHQQHKSTFTNLETELEEKLPPGEWIIDFPIEYNHFEEEAKRVLD